MSNRAPKAFRDAPPWRPAWQADIQPAEIAPSLLLAIVAEQRAEDEILLRAELADWPNDDPPRHGDELAVAETEK